MMETNQSEPQEVFFCQKCISEEHEYFFQTNNYMFQISVDRTSQYDPKWVQVMHSVIVDDEVEEPGDTCNHISSVI